MVDLLLGWYGQMVIQRRDHTVEELAQTNPGRTGGIMTTYLRKKNRAVFIGRMQEMAIEFLPSRAPLCAAVVTVLVWAGIIFGLVEACGK